MLEKSNAKSASDGAFDRFSRLEDRTESLSLRRERDRTDFGSRETAGTTNGRPESCAATTLIRMWHQSVLSMNKFLADFFNRGVTVKCSQKAGCCQWHHAFALGDGLNL